MAELNLNNIIQVNFPLNQYYQEEAPKKQIVLHHTVSSNAQSSIDWWTQTEEKVATPIIIEKDGKIYQLFSTRTSWAHHLGLHVANNRDLNKSSIAIEIVNWGALLQASNGKWYPVLWDDANKKYVPNTKAQSTQNIVQFPNGFRGFNTFEKYTAAQIESVRQLLVFWKGKYNIPLDYKSDMWDVSSRALSGEAGVWTHVSYRDDKSDCSPQKELIDMLKSLV